MKAALPLIIRLGERRVEQARRALGEALAEQRLASEHCDECAKAVTRANERATAADRDFRAQPQCGQRLLLREVRTEAVARAEAHMRGAEDARALAKDKAQAAAQALLRAETRLEEFRRLLKRQRAQAAEQAALREEDEFCARATSC